MYSRLNDQRGTPVPAVWQQELKNILAKTYPGGQFTVDALIYPNELWITVSVQGVAQHGLPITCELSLDIDQKTNMPDALNLLTDGLGRFLDDVFQDPANWDDYVPAWQADEQSKLFYRITREDLTLRQQADALLAAHPQDN